MKSADQKKETNKTNILDEMWALGLPIPVPSLLRVGSQYIQSQVWDRNQCQFITDFILLRHKWFAFESNPYIFEILILISFIRFEWINTFHQSVSYDWRRVVFGYDIAINYMQSILVISVTYSGLFSHLSIRCHSSVNSVRNSGTNFASDFHCDSSLDLFPECSSIALFLVISSSTHPMKYCDRKWILFKFYQKI